MKLNEIIELARFEFRRYGFRADGATIVQNGRLRKEVVVEFATEPATGQAAFSQAGVTSHLRIWHENNGDISRFDVEIPVTEVELGVSYTHHNGGRNGISRRYILAFDAFGGAPALRAAA
tara:strand:- start:1695 stop:2054 length:360 start_codon:yes stop_codon:yes gene_type:complete